MASLKCSKNLFFSIAEVKTVEYIGISKFMVCFFQTQVPQVNRNGYGHTPSAPHPENYDEVSDPLLFFERNRIKQLQDERLHIQKKTFTKWVNSFLNRVSLWFIFLTNWRHFLFVQVMLFVLFFSTFTWLGRGSVSLDSLFSFILFSNAVKFFCRILVKGFCVLFVSLLRLLFGKVRVFFFL